MLIFLFRLALRPSFHSYRVSVIDSRGILWQMIMFDEFICAVCVTGKLVGKSHNRKSNLRIFCVRLFFLVIVTMIRMLHREITDFQCLFWLKHVSKRTWTVHQCTKIRYALRNLKPKTESQIKKHKKRMSHETETKPGPKQKKTEEHEETNFRSAFNNEKCIESNLKKFVINCRVICNGIYLDLTIVHATSSVWLNRSEKEGGKKKKCLPKNQNDKRQTTFAIWNDNSHHSLNQCLSEWSLSLSHSVASVHGMPQTSEWKVLCFIKFFSVLSSVLSYSVSVFFFWLKIKFHLSFQRLGQDISLAQCS